MAPALNTIPQAPADEAALLTKPSSTKTSLKGLVAGAAVASFVLGCLAATAVSAAAPRAPAAFHSHSSFQLQGDDGRCLTASSIKSEASVKSEYCNGRSSQLWQRIGSGFTGKLKLANTDLCLDALGGIKFMDARHKHWGLYACKESRNQNLYFDGNVIMLDTDDAFEFIDGYPVCLNLNGGAEITTFQDTDDCDAWEKISAGPGPTPAPPPTPRPSGPKCGDRCTSDVECAWMGGDGSACTKCYKGRGQESVCVHPGKPAPAPTPRPSGKGKCDIKKSPQSQGARSCHSDADCSNNGSCSYCRQHSTSIHGHSWQRFCMNPSDQP